MDTDSELYKFHMHKRLVQQCYDRATVLFANHNPLIYNLIYYKLPNEHKEWTLTDIGSGTGYFSMCMFPYWKTITNIEPNDELRNLYNVNIRSKLISARNVHTVKDQLPNCIKDIDSDAIVLFNSIYLTTNWLENFSALLENKNLKWFCVVDGADKDITTWHSSPWKTPAEATVNRRPMLPGVEKEFLKAANDAGFKCEVYDQVTFSTSNIGNEWIMIGNRNGY